MKPLRPNSRQALKTYYEVPMDILENAETLRRAKQPTVSPPRDRA